MVICSIFFLHSDASVKKFDGQESKEWITSMTLQVLVLTVFLTGLDKHWIVRGIQPI